MRLRLLTALLLLATLTAGEDPQLPWVPSTLDDWASLQRSSASYATTMRAARRTLYPHPSDRFWDRNWHAINIPKPPTGTGSEDLIILDLMIKTGPASSQSGGQVVVWRGADGKAIGVTIYFQWHQLPKSNPPLFSDEKLYLAALDQLLADAPPPVGAWKVDKGPKHWCAIWLREGGRVATLDDRRGMAPDLRPEDLKWLSTAPRPLPAAPAVKTLDQASYTERVAAHAQVQAALARARMGYPERPLAVASVARGSQAEAHDWKIGDLLLSIDGVVVEEAHQVSQLRQRTGDSNVIVLQRPDGSKLQTQVKSGKLGITIENLARDPGLAVLRLAGDKAVDAAVVLYACGDADLVATALNRLRDALGLPATSFLHAWRASYAGDYGLCAALLSGKATAEPRLQWAMNDLLTANIERSGRLLVAYPQFKQAGHNAMVLRHLVKDLAPAERFALFETGLPAQAYPETANEAVRPVHRASEVLLQVGSGTPTATDEALTVDVRLDGIPGRCRLDFSVALKPAELNHPGNRMESPIQQYVMLRFGRSTKQAFNNAGCGGVRLWLDGSIEVAGANLDIDQWGPTWRTVPGRVVADGKTMNTVSMIRMGQLQRIEVNGRLVLQGFLPLVAGAKAGEELAMAVQTSAIASPISGFRVTMPAGPPVISDF